MKDLNSLIIGDSSQLSYFFPLEYDRVSSRNINIEVIKEKKYDRVYILFAEQRTFLNDSLDFFLKINFDLTLKVIDNLLPICNKIVIYSTAELWNNYNGCVNIEDPYNYNETPYIRSKEILCNHINKNRDKYSNVVIVYPFNFNSIYRKEGFLFSKIYKSLLYNKKESIGNIDFNRDLTHPKIIVENSMSANYDMLIGSGELINVKNFIYDIFKSLNKNLEDYISFEEKNDLPNKRKEYFSCVKYSNYEELLKLTTEEIYGYKIS